MIVCTSASSFSLKWLLEYYVFLKNILPVLKICYFSVLGFILSHELNWTLKNLHLFFNGFMYVTYSAVVHFSAQLRFPMSLSGQ